MENLSQHEEDLRISVKGLRAAMLRVDTLTDDRIRNHIRILEDAIVELEKKMSEIEDTTFFSTEDKRRCNFIENMINILKFQLKYKKKTLTEVPCSRKIARMRKKLLED